MPRYFFHTTDGEPDRDEQGTELPDIGAARRAAVRYAGDVLSDQPNIVWHGQDFRVNVADEAGARVCTILVLAVDGVEPEAET